MIISTSFVPSAPPSVRIRSLTHRGKEVWMVTFSFSRVLYSRSKKMHGQYSQTHMGWWWPAEEKEELQQKLWGNKAPVKSEIKKNQLSASSAGISEKVIDKIREMEVWMLQKRYSQKVRRVALWARVLQELRQYYKSYIPREYLFEGQNGGQYSISSAAQVLKRAVMKAGVKKG